MIIGLEGKPMPFKEASLVESRKEFVRLATAPNANRRELCRRFGISPTRGYEWINRYLKQGDEGLINRSRRPNQSPGKTSDDVELLIEQLRLQDPSWGAPKIKKLLAREFGIHRAESTVHAILKRRNLISQEASDKSHTWQRFERSAPNELWQMDFKGHFATAEGRCFPLTILDDHSRYSLALTACRNEQEPTVREILIATFRKYGLPWAIINDNGNPWGNASAGHPYTRLTVWLIRNSISTLHSRPLHPQTLGKDERFHRTLLAEIIGRRAFLSFADVQRAFDPWRERYNHYRPHEALGMDVPADRFQISPRPYSEKLQPIAYDTTDIVRTVDTKGTVRLNGKRFFLCVAFAGEPVALRRTDVDGVLDVYYCHQRFSQIDERNRDQ
ncbi:MAG: IS481 family transposase [Thermoanaerobaculia bacterium]